MGLVDGGEHGRARKLVQYIGALQINRHQNASISTRGVGREIREWEDETEVVANTHTKDSSTADTIGGEGVWWETGL